ncbi:hypothetical protein [Asanoa siamensis]|uniref:Secreted protein n=1 Tax=Asanoa siamensis TaxID=926357 RepID=A0ABQ4CIX2_9ACTN|nr:hypothetical protein [Asanoa siamensis]GIF71245.1 hypothetical protein Asi02nite_07630 [Asanoa siamensis]
MKVRLSRTRGLIVAAVAAGATVAVAVPAGAAVQLQSESPPATVRIVESAQLKANGAGLVATVLVKCKAGTSFTAQVDVSQRVGGVVTRGGGYVYGTCTGSRERVKIGLSPSPKAFKAGEAFATADVNFEYPYWTTVQARREITLVG